ncbi:extensin [Hippoglossus stenolepis]|uniref:extensin n=1 Tax=Hippoglossus stenolepis TaxID=195615 RepID=UPI001FB021E9|nr:extensin [Hippoglossus stenolepis]
MKGALRRGRRRRTAAGGEQEASFTMKATAKHKAVTSGRLTGGAKVQPPRRQVNPGPPARPPEPAYSLYSTDPEEQVTTLHQGLDRCAALLSGILQADTTEASPRLHRAGTCGAAKSRPSTSLGKKSIKKVPKKTVHKNPPSGQRGAGSTTPTPQSPTPAAHSGVKLHPTLRRVHTKAHHSPYAPPPQPHPSIPLHPSPRPPSLHPTPLSSCLCTSHPLSHLLVRQSACLVTSRSLFP